MCQPDLDMLFIKLTAQLGDYTRKTPYAHYASDFGDLMAIKWGLPWGLLCRNSGRRKLCIMPCHSCLIYGIWRSKEVGDTLKLSFGLAMQATGGVGWEGGGHGGVLMGKGGSHSLVLLYWSFIVSLLGIVKDFIGYLFFLCYCGFTCFVSTEIGKAKSAINTKL